MSQSGSASADPLHSYFPRVLPCLVPDSYFTYFTYLLMRQKRMGDGVLKRSASARPTLLVLYLGFPLTLLTLLSLLTLHFPDCTHAQKKKVVDCLQERLRETKTAKFLVLLYLLCLLYSHTHTQKVVDYFNERPSSRDQKTVKFYTLSISLLYSCAKKKKVVDWIPSTSASQVLHTVSLYFTTLTLLTLLKGGGLSQRTPSRDQDRQVF